MVPAGQRMEEACREYQSSLEDLTFNSKPHINMLTILAEENVGFAKDIVAIIEAQISKAPAAEKLPVLYLVDSIVKNVGGEFLAVFAKNLITSFICVFEKVDENTRKSLFKLRSTWDEVFPLKKLYLLDVRINALDPAWPIKPLPSIVNASIHVNPRFLKQSDEASDSTATPAKSPAPSAVTPPPPPPSTVNQSSVTQEQLIRQQLLAKQKQLLELQQKKIELELEQTKAQLAGGFALPNTVSTPTPSVSTASKPVSQPSSVVRPWIPPQTDTKPSPRDPRLNRPWPPVELSQKDFPAGKKDGATAPSNTTPEKKQCEKSSRADKARTAKKDCSEEKSRKKESLEEKPRTSRKDGHEDNPKSPLAKSVQLKNKLAEAELQKTAEGSKKDPRLKKRPQDKAADSKDDNQKEKKRCNEKKEREDPQRGNSKVKLLNGSVAKPDDDVNSKTVSKMGGNARLHPRKRTHSRSRSRSPASSPKRKERRSPKSRTRSNSLSPSPSRKVAKPRRGRVDEPQHMKPGRDDRLGTKKNQSEGRRSKRPTEDRRSESRDSHSPRGHDGGGKELLKEAPHRWKSGWEENKHQKMGGEAHVKGSAQRHKPYTTPNRPSMPRTPKHRLSVDSNLQIPDVLNTASKKDLLRRASKRLESGEITKEEFLNMAHQIKHFFQYQEEKLQRSDSWEEPLLFGKEPLLSSPTNAAQPRPHQVMDPAELSYYEHKSKLRKTQVNHRLTAEEWEGDGEGADAGKMEKMISGRNTGVPPSQKYGRTPRERAGERRSKEREDARLSHSMVEDYNHGKEFPPLKSLPGLRFMRRADPRETSEREWTSPLTERQHLNTRDEHKSSYDAPRRYAPPTDPRRSEGPACREAGGPRYERLSPLKDIGDQSPRFESPNSEHSDDASPLTLEGPPPQHIRKGPARGGQLSLVRQHGSSPGHTPPRDGDSGPSCYNGPTHLGPSRQQPWYEGGGPQAYEDSQFEGPLPSGPGRFEGRLHPKRAECDGPHGALGPVRGGDGMVPFEGPHQGPGMFVGQQPPLRNDGHGLGLSHLEAPRPRFEVPHHFNNRNPPSRGPLGPVLHFDGPSRFESPGRFEGAGQGGPRFDMPHQAGNPRFEYTSSQPQGPPRFAQQPPLPLPGRPVVQPVFDSSLAPQQNFPLGPQRFPEPINPQFSTGGAMGFQQPGLQTGGSFNMQPAFNQPRTFYQHTQPTEPALNLLGTMNQSFINPGPFSQQAVVENHFGQVDINYLMSKLISTGIIKASTPDAAAPPSGDSNSEPPAAPQLEEEEEEEQEEEEGDVPDLTAFSVEEMKQRFESVVLRLYSGNQCCLCSMRFTAAQTDLYADHLDWHFRQNHAGKVAGKKVTHRRWYYSLTDWIEFEEIADLEERAKSHFFEKENEEEVQKNQAAAKEKEFQSVRATKDQVGECCEICQEPFETYWVEEEEDWFLKNAVRVDDKNFHPSCFEDYSNTSSYVDTPAPPSKLHSEHSQQLEHLLEKQETEMATSCAVKQEVKSECEQES